MLLGRVQEALLGLNSEVQTDLFAVFCDCSSQRMLTVVFCCSHDGQQSRARHLVPLHNYLDLDNVGGTVCDGPSLIKHHRLDLASKEEMTSFLLLNEIFRFM